jgi:Reverse transcriptase (RNA-dependent DNA polymerase)
VVERDKTEHRSKLDSHAEQTCVGDNVTILFEWPDRTIDVEGFLESLGCVQNAPVVTAAMVYDDPLTGNAILFIAHQAIYIKGMENNLYCPMQLRWNGLTVNERPKHCTIEPAREDHAIIVPDGDYLIPLSLHGITSYFPTRKPTEEELQRYSDNGDYIELTAESPEWDPHSLQFADLESRMTDRYGEIVERTLRNPQQLFTMVTDCHYEYPFVRRMYATTTSRRPGPYNAELLSSIWGIGRETAERTLRATTQRGVRHFDGKAPTSVGRRFPTGDRKLRYNRLSHPVYHDTLFASITLFCGNTCSHIYATDFGWSRNFPIKSKGEAWRTLDDMFHQYGVPTKLISDGARELTLGEFAKTAQKAGCPMDITNPYSPWQNSAESEIREVKRLAGRWMVKARSPKRLWDYCTELASQVRSNTAHNLYQLHGQTPETKMTGVTKDISHLCEFGWYEWVMYHHPESFPNDKEQLGKYLGPTRPGVGSVMSYHVLRENGNVIVVDTLRKLTPQEMESGSHERLRHAFEQAIEKRHGPGTTELDLEDMSAPVKSEAKGKKKKGTPRQISAITPAYEVYEDDTESHKRMPEADTLTGELDDPDTYDAYVTAQVCMPKDDVLELGTVIKRKRDAEGNLIGGYDDNPALDSRVYEVEFSDGQVLEYSANLIAENLYSQVDEEGHHQVMIDEIIDHQSDASAVKPDDGWVTVRGRKSRRITTKGWKLCVRWKDGSTSWEPLADMKEAYPVQTAEYAVMNKLEHQPAFAWWVGPVLRRRDRIIISATQKRYHKRTHKFGIELPKSVKAALEIDKRTGTTYWRDALKKEMTNVRVAFDVLDDDDKLPVDWQRINCHMVFDIKMGSLERKCRLVAGGHMTDPPAAITYASVVSRESIQIALTIAALNGLKVLAADIKNLNAYLNSPCEEKVWTVLGPEFGPELEGKRAKIVRSLYGLKSAGAAYRYHLATCMEHLGYQSCRADPDVWLRENSDHNNTRFYEYVLIYTDDILAVGKDPQATLDRINKYFTLKEGSVKEPDIYLGAKLRRIVGSDGTEAWTQSSSSYIQEAVKNVESWLDEHNMKLPNRSDTPMSTGCRPELDTTPELDPETANWYQSAIGVLRWAIELGRIDITTECSMLASHMALPREGHLVAVLRVFSYLKKHHNSRIVFDPSYPEIDHNLFIKHNWTRFYSDAKEPIPPNAPEPLGNPVVLRMYVDADHAGDVLTHRSRTGYIRYMNSAIMNWYSKKQGSVEGATFGSEFMAMKTAAEVNKGFRYKLRMMGIPIDGPTYVYGDNMWSFTTPPIPNLP